MSQSKRKGMIRPIGIVAFGVVTTLLVLAFYMLAPWLIKQSVESVGTKINGAKVELEDVDISLSPAGLYFYSFQVADAKHPMDNVFELDQAYAELDLFELWSGKVIVDDLNIQNLRFGTKRKSSGAIVAGEDEQGENASGVQAGTDSSDGSGLASTAAEQLSRLGSELPDAQELLAQHPLQTTKLSEQLDASCKAQKSEWKETSSTLPDDKRLDYYESEFKALTEGDIKSLDEFNQRKKKLDVLKQELKKDKAMLLKAKEQLSNSKQLVEQGLRELKNAPQQDFKDLKNTYSLDASGGLNLSGLLFGSQFQSYAESAWYWYNRLAPLMTSNSSEEEGDVDEDVVVQPRGAGRFIHFSVQGTSPDFLIRSAAASAQLSQGQVQLNGRNITHQQYLTGKPSVLTAGATQLDDTDQFDMNLTIDHRTDETKDTFSLMIKGQTLDKLTLSKSDRMPLELGEAKLDVNSNIELSGLALAGSVDSKFNNTKFTTSGPSSVAKELGAALESVNTFSLNAEVGGRLNNPDFDISSDLDKVLKEAFLGRFKDKQKEWEAKLKSGLNEKLNTYLTENENLAGYFSEQSEVLNGDLSTIDNLLQQQLDSYVDTQKKEAEDKLKDKLKGLF